MVQHASSIGGVALRVTKLSATGAPVVGNTSSYVQLGDFISLSFTPEYEEGDEFSQKGANGSVCATFKMPDTLKRVNFELAVCKPNPGFEALLSGGIILSTAGASPEDIGWAAPEVGKDETVDVAIEVWSNAIVDGKRDATYPYWWWAFPLANLRPSGSRVVENGILANTYEGWGVGNSGFDNGPQHDWLFPDATSRPYMYARTATAPATAGFQEVTAG